MYIVLYIYRYFYLFLSSKLQQFLKSEYNLCVFFVNYMGHPIVHRDLHFSFHPPPPRGRGNIVLKKFGKNMMKGKRKQVEKIRKKGEKVRKVGKRRKINQGKNYDKIC